MAGTVPAAGDSGDGSVPTKTLWATSPRANPTNLVTVWSRYSSTSQGGASAKINSALSNGKFYGSSQPPSAQNISSLIVVPVGSGHEAGNFLGTFGDFSSTFQGDAENTTPADFASAGAPSRWRYPLLELRPDSTGTLPPGKLLGRFELQADGTLTFTALAAPTVVTAPTDVLASTNASSSATFTVATTGDGLGYQWSQNGTPLSDGSSISGSQTASLNLTNLVNASAGTVLGYDHQRCWFDQFIRRVDDCAEACDRDAAGQRDQFPAAGNERGLQRGRHGIFPVLPVVVQRRQHRRRHQHVLYDDRANNQRRNLFRRGQQLRGHGECQRGLLFYPGEGYEPAYCVGDRARCGEGVPHWTSSTYLVQGHAVDNKGVVAVLYSLNGGGFTNSAVITGNTNWSAAITLAVGTNTFVVEGTDLAGNISALVTRTIVYVPASPITLTIVGGGHLTTNWTGGTLDIGKAYTITATPTATAMCSATGPDLFRPRPITWSSPW